MVFLVKNFYNFIASEEFLFLTEILASSVKICFFYFLLSKAFKTKKITFPLSSLLVLLISGFLVDCAWIIRGYRHLFDPTFDIRFCMFFIRLAWTFNIIQFHALSFFIESLLEKKTIINVRQKVSILISAVPCSYFIVLGIAFYNYPGYRTSFEFFMMGASFFYISSIIILPTLYLTLKKLKHKNYPEILRKQLTIFIKYLIFPYMLTETINNILIIQNLYFNAVTSTYTLLLTFAIYYAMRKVMGLRFLNFQNHVQASRSFNFIDDFKNVLEQLSHTNSLSELSIVMQLFFKEAFKVPVQHTHLYIRIHTQLNAKAQEQKPVLSTRELIVERYITKADDAQDILAYLREHRIVIYDEIVFNNFYHETAINLQVIQFLERINAAVFIPIFEHTSLVAYIMLDRDGRAQEFYSDVERDEMIVFASYLGKIVHLLQNRNLGLLIAQEKELREELFLKHQENNQYKESIRSFLRSSNQRKIGIIFYKNKKFTLGNQAAQELVPVDLNTHIGHPLTKVCKQLAEHVQAYKTAQQAFAQDAQGNKLILVGLPNLDHTNVIITVYYPEIADIIKKQLDILHNPSEWDYLLYLETTQSGKLINQLVPSSGSHFLNFKIELLKTALSKKALLLQMPEADLTPTVEIIHHISLREKLEVINAHTLKNTDLAIHLFGVNPLLGFAQKPSLLEQLNSVGTLFIQNIHALDGELQEKLAEFIKYGYFTVFKGDQRIVSDVRIIVSTHANIETLIQEGKFSQSLYNELQKTSLCLPPLTALAQEEIQELVEGVTQQALHSSVSKNLLALNDREKNSLIDNRPMSLMQFKAKILQTLAHKSKKSNGVSPLELDSNTNLTDPTLIQAARLGKKALKDPKMMSILWNRFKNQNKIAAFLGVNRSSINRRLKDYNIG